MTTPRLLSTAVVLDRVCMSKTQLYRLITAGEFPKPVPIGRQRIGFLESDVNAWIDARLRLRDEGAGAESRRQRAIRAVGGRS
jgi:prophage regulatory protein